MPRWILLFPVRQLVKLPSRIPPLIGFIAYDVTSGTDDDFCQAGCLSDYGTCKGISIIDSWRRAEKNGKTDEEAGGQYYWDSKTNLFWSWDTPELIARKFTDIVEAKKLGGVMAWSLGEDTYKFAHLEAMQKGVKDITKQSMRQGKKESQGSETAMNCNEMD